MRLQLVTTTDRQPDFLEFPWTTRLSEWPPDIIIDVPRGIHRHVVKFVMAEGRVFALKELPHRLAEREWDILRHLQTEGLPVVTAQGVVSDRGDDLDDVLITRHLQYSIPYHLIIRGAEPAFIDKLIDALAGLLVRLHLEGFFWGDCSLSNTLFRRDAGALSAYVVDTETGELHEQLSDGQRALDLDTAVVNIAGGLLDLEASGRLPGHVDPMTVAEDLDTRYRALWTELTTWQEISLHERHRIDERLARLNELGFDTAEIALNPTDGDRLRFRPVVVEDGHHRRQLIRLTQLDVQENQARRLLNDMWSYGAYIEGLDGQPLPAAVVAYRWLREVFEPSLYEIPWNLEDRREAAELYHEILCHRDKLAAEGRELRVPEAAAEYADSVLPALPTERTITDTP